MSEEKPTFKVTDRRLFNADGTPRDVEREEEEKPPAAAAEAPQPDARPDEAAAAATAEAAPRAAPDRADEGRAPRESDAQAARDEDAELAADAGGDQEFFMLVEFLASFAADALGMVNHPGGGGGVNLQLAKQCIDMIGTVQRKSRGNLSGEEQQFLDMILSQLRMQYVSLTNAPRPPKGGRGFTGGDITGGR